MLLAHQPVAAAPPAPSTKPHASMRTPHNPAAHGEIIGQRLRRLAKLSCGRDAAAASRAIRAPRGSTVIDTGKQVGAPSRCGNGGATPCRRDRPGYIVRPRGTLRPESEGQVKVDLAFEIDGSDDHPVSIRLSTGRAAFDGAVTLLGATLVRATRMAGSIDRCKCRAPVADR